MTDSVHRHPKHSSKRMEEDMRMIAASLLGGSGDLVSR